MSKKYMLNGTKIKELCKLKNTSARDLANHLGISENEFSRKITNSHACSHEQILMIVNFFETFFSTHVNLYDIATYYPEESKTVNIPAAKQVIRSGKSKNLVLNKNLIKARLHDEHYSLREFSRLLGAGYSSLSRWINGGGLPMPEYAVALASYFNIELNELFIDKDTKEQEEETVDTTMPFAPSKEEIVTASSKKETTEAQVPAYTYKIFEEGNVLGNMKVINDNIIMLSKQLSNNAMSGDAANNFKYFNDVTKNMEITLAEMQNKMDEFEATIMDALKAITLTLSNTDSEQPKAISKMVIPRKNLSNEDVIEMCKTGCKDNGFPTYKDKITKLITYISKKKNLIYNQVAYDFYKNFEKVYGMSLSSITKASKDKTTNVIEAIYDEPVAREIFFNIIATEASHLAGDMLSVQPV